MFSAQMAHAAKAVSELRIWTHLAARDLRVRYTRTRLGPWWSAVAQGALIAGIAIAVALIAQDPVQDYLPRIAVSLMTWTFIANVFLESVELFTVERSLLLNTRVSELALVLRVIWRQVLLSLYNLPVIFICVVIGGAPVSLRLLLFPICLLFTGFGLLFPSLTIALLTLIRRDFAQIVPSLVQLLFFVSPVMWQTPSTGRLNLLSDLNPIAWTLEAVRNLVLAGSIQWSFQLRWLGVVAVMVTLTFLISPISRYVRLHI